MTSAGYKAFIENEFDILDRDSNIVPFKLFDVQAKYLKLMGEDYRDMEGVREIILKARQEGMSSFVLALFTVDFITHPNSISICIAHKKDATQKLFKKVKFYIDSYCKKHGFDTDSYLLSDNKNEIESRANGSYFYLGTAGSKVGGRGGTAQNILFSEAAFYQDTDLITAQEIIEGSAQQVSQGAGKIFIESTANGFGNYYQVEWERAVKQQSAYHPRFFSWEEFYSDEWVKEKIKAFQSEDKFKQEYPRTPEEAFIRSGTPFFDMQKVDEQLRTNAIEPLRQGRLATDGEWI
jgi:hypothetical protein